MKSYGVILFALMLAAAAGCSVEILHDVDESEANSVVAALQREGIVADKTRVSRGATTTYTLSVPRAQAPQAWRALRQQNLPRPKQQGLGEVFGKVGLVPTRTQEQALLRHALAGEISRTLQSLEGVQEARVHIVLPQREPLASSDEPRAKPRAAVLLRIGQRDAISAEEVRQLVAGSVDGLEMTKVNVVMHPTVDHRSTSLAATTGLVSVGPFRVTPESRALLVATLVASILLMVALAIASMLFFRRAQSLANTMHLASSSPVEPSPDSSLQLLERSMTRRVRGTTKGSAGRR